LKWLIGDYVRQITDWLAPQLTSGLLVRMEASVEGCSLTLGSIRLKLVWSDGSELHVREFIDLASHPVRLSYAYHYQTAGQPLIFRYDNARHKPDLGFADHRHASDGTVTHVTAVPDLGQVVTEVVNTMTLGRQP